MTASPSAVAPVPPPVPPSVLLVEDAEDNREMYATFLTHSGLKVVQAATAYQALREIEQEPPDVIVTDIALPGLDGVEFCRELRQHETMSRTPVIALTGLKMNDVDIRRALEAGSDVVLFKPCLPDRLLQEIQSLLNRSAQVCDASHRILGRAQRLSARCVELQQRSSQLRERAFHLLSAVTAQTLVDRIMNAYIDAPALVLTLDQAQQRWTVDRLTCEVALRTLTARGFLRQTSSRTFVRA